MTVAALFFAVVFLTAATAKVDSWPVWATAVEGWGLGPAWSRVVRMAIPPAEMACVVAIIASPRAGLTVSASLLIVFGLGAAAITRREPARGIPCGCFGAGTPEQLGYRLAGRNAALALIAAALVIRGDATDYPRAYVLLTTLLVWAAYAVLRESLSQGRELRSATSESAT